MRPIWKMKIKREQMRDAYKPRCSRERIQLEVATRHFADLHGDRLGFYFHFGFCFCFPTRRAASRAWILFTGGVCIQMDFMANKISHLFQSLFTFSLVALHAVYCTSRGECVVVASMLRHSSVSAWKIVTIERHRHTTYSNNNNNVIKPAPHSYIDQYSTIIFTMEFFFSVEVARSWLAFHSVSSLTSTTCLIRYTIEQSVMWINWGFFRGKWKIGVIIGSRSTHL